MSSPIGRFWQETLQRLANEPLDAGEEIVTEAVPYQKYSITYRSLDGVPIRAYLAKPVIGERPEKPLPVIISAPGYGGLEQSVMLSECQRGIIVLQIYPRGQGDSQELWQFDGADKLTDHLENPEGHYYQGGYCDLIRGVDYLLSRPDVDASRIGMMGTSQAGGMVLAAGALDDRVKAVVAHVPFLCDMRACAERDGSLVQRLLNEFDLLDSENLQTLDYFDPLHLASGLKAPVLMSAGGRDAVCPPDSIRAVFDKLPGIKSLIHYPDLAHTSCGDFYRMSWEWMERWLQ